MTTYTIDVRNVNDGYYRTLSVLEKFGKRVETRNGPALSIPGLFMAHVRQPGERVLFDHIRDANPVFHLLESCWMLAGRNDVAFVSQFNGNMMTYSDDKKTFNAAYGYRWVNHFGYDQVTKAIEMLKANPNNRRVYIGMWDPAQDLGADTLDVPCNLGIAPRIINGTLQFTVFNRSNDAIFGLWGANAVHLSFLQEWMAAALGVGLGQWVQVSNDLHIYERHWDLFKAKRDYYYTWAPWVGSQPLVQNAEVFRRECIDICNGKTEDFQEPFLEDTLEPMYAAWREWKAGDKAGAIEIAASIEAADWRKATVAWLKRRAK